jgi:hypothetical protein
MPHQLVALAVVADLMRRLRAATVPDIKVAAARSAAVVAVDIRVAAAVGMTDTGNL